jgi:hypothetical protein
MKNYLSKSVMTLVCLTACLTLVFVPAPVQAQSSPIGLTIRVNPTISSPGGTVGVFGIITNNTSSKLRTTVTLSSLSACGIQTQIGYTRVALNAGQSMQITVSYPLAPDACVGLYAVSIGASSGGKNASESSATAYLTVQ